MQKSLWPHWGMILRVVFGMVALVVALSVGMATYTRKTRSPIPPAVAEKALFETYYPARLPKGFALDSRSYHFTDGAVVFSASAGDGRQLAFTETALPKDYDLNDFYETLAKPKKLVNKPYTAVSGSMPGHKTVVSVVIGSTWIIISSQQSLSESDQRLLAQHLRL